MSKRLGGQRAKAMQSTVESDIADALDHLARTGDESAVQELIHNRRGRMNAAHYAMLADGVIEAFTTSSNESTLSMPGHDLWLLAEGSLSAKTAAADGQAAARNDGGAVFTRIFQAVLDKAKSAPSDTAHRLYGYAGYFVGEARENPLVSDKNWNIVYDAVRVSVDPGAARQEQCLLLMKLAGRGAVVPHRMPLWEDDLRKDARAVVFAPLPLKPKDETADSPDAHVRKVLHILQSEGREMLVATAQFREWDAIVGIALMIETLSDSLDPEKGALLRDRFAMAQMPSRFDWHKGHRSTRCAVARPG